MAIGDALDPVSAPVAQLFGMGSQEWSNAFGPELLVYAEEIPSAVFLTGIGRTLLGVASGLATLLYAGFGGVGGRDKVWALEMAAHFLTHPGAGGVFSAGSLTPASLSSELTMLRNGIASANLDMVRSSLSFTPQDIEAAFRDAMAQLGNLAPFLPLPPGVAPPAVPPSAATPELALTQELASAVGYGDVF